ncbi:amino acid ABC transporter permease [Albidovulum sp.]|uniref:amino acid ABC transporter permease n=1 Tax=Albidovulum sp. TaxID=1872424 RepID=UPI0039B97F01
MTNLLGYALIIAQALGTTIFLSIACFTIGGLAAVPVVVARLSESRLARAVAQGFIAIVRGVPPITWLLIIFFGLPQLGLRLPSMVAGIFGLSLICSAYLAEIYRAGWLALPKGQFEACKAIGLTSAAAFRKVIAPQAFVTILPMAITFFIGLLKETSFVSVIGVREVTETALSLSRTEPDPFDVFMAAGLIYLAISLPIGIAGRITAPWVARRFGMAS